MVESRLFSTSAKRWTNQSVSEAVFRPDIAALRFWSASSFCPFIMDDGLTSAESDAVVAVTGVVATAIQTSKDYMTPHSHLSTHRDLQEIADKGWSVPTHVLARIFGQSNGTLDAWGKLTHRLGFLIERTGNRDMFRVFVARDQ